MSNTRKRMPKVCALIGLVMAGTVGVSTPLDAQGTGTKIHEQREGVDQEVVAPAVGDFPGGRFRVQGRLHYRLFIHQDAAGGCHINGHVNPQGLRVTGPLGTGPAPEYKAVGAANFTANSSGQQDATGATPFHAVVNLNLIGQAKAPDIRLHQRVRGTVPAGCKATPRELITLVLEALQIVPGGGPGAG
ncbi:MAG: hypothetical protein M3303_15730 [Gemmatimonadota bacterium]|nr:hypothetical protein [Gemmatimonadota bacterium]